MSSFSAVVALACVSFAAVGGDMSNLIAPVAFKVGFGCFCSFGRGRIFLRFRPYRCVVGVFLRLGFLSLLLLGLPHFGACPLGAAMWPPAVYTFFWLLCRVFAGSVVTPAFRTCGFVLLAGVRTMPKFVAFRTHQWLRPLL